MLGLLWGSFANVCIYRWPPTDEFPSGRSVVKPGSHCFACKTPIRWYDNVPLLELAVAARQVPRVQGARSRRAT